VAMGTPGSQTLEHPQKLARMGLAGSSGLDSACWWNLLIER